MWCGDEHVQKLTFSSGLLYEYTHETTSSSMPGHSADGSLATCVMRTFVMSSYSLITGRFDGSPRAALGPFGVTAWGTDPGREASCFERSISAASSFFVSSAVRGVNVRLMGGGRGRGHVPSCLSSATCWSFAATTALCCLMTSLSRAFSSRRARFSSSAASRVRKCSVQDWLEFDGDCFDSCPVSSWMRLSFPVGQDVNLDVRKDKCATHS